jgi:DNA-binding CsgD family transcriptional regulator
VADGRDTEATETLLSSGRNAVEGEHLAWGCVCFHDCVRLGRADLVIDEMRSLDFPHGAHLMANMKRHAEMFLDRDGEGLLDVGTDFLGMGAPLLAASAWAQAASLLNVDEPTSAALAAGLSMIAESFCEKPETPALLGRPRLVSRREIEVILQALKGVSSSDIGHALHISARTVDNHLHHVYQKLGVGGRDELATRFAPAIEAIRADHLK